MSRNQNIRLASVDELLGAAGLDGESAEEIEIRKLRVFKKHPFKILNDERMDDLVESIRENGVLTPILVRPIHDGDGYSYEIISGHRRTSAAELAGLNSVPAVVRDLSDDEATICMVDANIQREELLASEKAFSYRMKLEALKHQGKLAPEMESGRSSADVVGEAAGDSGRQVQRYIRLTYLHPQLLAMVDEKKLPVSAGVELSYLSEELQEWVAAYVENHHSLNPAQLSALRECREGVYAIHSQISLFNLLNDFVDRPKPRKVTIPEKNLSRYFPSSYSREDMEKVIYDLLEEWRDSQDCEGHEREE